MSEIRLNRLTAETGAPDNTDRLIVIPAGAFTIAGTDTAQREQAAANNPPRTWTLESLRTYFQQGIQTPATAFTALTDTPSSLGTAGQFLAVNSASNALEFVDAPSGGGQAETGASIVTKLEALASGSRLSYNALDDTPTIPTLRTAAETVTLLETLRGADRLDITAIKGYAPGDTNVPADWDETDTTSHAFIRNKPTIPSTLVALTDTPSALGTAGQILAVNNAANALEFIDAPSGAAAETGTTIVSKLAALTGASRLSYTALRDTPTIPVLRTAAQTVALLEGLTGNARLDAAAIKNLPEPQGGGLTSVHTDASLSGLGTQASPLAVANPFTADDELKLDGIAAGAEVNQTTAQIVTALEALTGAARLDYSALDNAPDIPDAEINEFQFAVATVSQSLQADDALGNAAAGVSVGKDLSFANTRDAASLGFTDASGRLSFGNTHTDRDTPLLINGRVPITHTGLGGRLRILFREFTATQADTVNREVEIANHPITESSTLRSFHFPVTGTQVRVRRGRTYKVFVEFTAEAGAAANGQVSIAYTLNDNENLIAFNRFQLRLTDLVDAPDALGTAGQVLAVSSGGNLLEFVDATSEATAVELFSTLREANALTALADTDTLFGWDASASNGVEISLATLKAFVGGGDDSGGEGTTTFLGLTDTPSAFGTAGQFLAVNSATNALEFVAAPSGGSTVQGGIGDNLLSAAVDLPATARIQISLVQLVADIGARLEDGNFYTVTFGAGSANTSTPRTALTKIIKMDGGNGEIVLSDEEMSFLAGTPSIANHEFDFRTGTTGNTSLWYSNEGISVGANRIQIRAIHAFAASSGGGGASTFAALTDTPDALGSAGQIPVVNADGDALVFTDAPSGGGTFPAVTSLPAPTEFNQTADLTHLDAANNAVPGLYRTINNPVTMRNRSMATIAVDPLQNTIFGASLDPANTFGHIDDARAIGKFVFGTGAVPFANVGINVALTGSTRTQIYIDFGSSEFGSDITRRILFNRGTTSGNFTLNGITYRDWTIAAAEADQSTDEVVRRLRELQDESGDNDITLDLYDAATGGNPINHIPAYVWQNLSSQEALQPVLEMEDKSRRILLAERIFADNNVMRSYPTEAAAIADGVLTQDDLVFKVRNKTPGSADDVSRIFTVDGAIAGSGGTRGSVSHRNRFSAMLLTMGDNNGFYYTAQYRSALRTFGNVQVADDVDPQSRIGYISFYDSGGTGNRPYVEVGIDPALTTLRDVALLLMNRQTSTGGNAPQLDVMVTRTGQTGTFAGKVYNSYRYTLNATQASALGVSGWLFKDDVVIFDLVSDILRSESVINFNPDEVQFTTGTGYVAPTGAIAAATRQISAPWVTVYTNTQRNTPTGIGGSWNLDRDISDAFEVRVAVGNRTAGDPTGRKDEDSRLLIPPLIVDDRANAFPVGDNTWPDGGAGSDNYLVRIGYGTFLEFVFARQPGSASGVIDRIVRVDDVPGGNNDAEIYNVQARF